jgi:NTE family protein
MSQKVRSALVLSAGGMFGAYQAGVWSELARVFRPDMVVGASAGALNGWEIACDTDPADLVASWMGLEKLASLKWRLPSRFADGCLDGTALEEWIRAAYAGRTPGCEYGVVLSHVPDLKPVLFRTPQITWKHIAASCAVPGFLRHFQLDGQMYTDGGIVDPLPLWAAVEMGAQVIVTVNVLQHRPWLIRPAVQALRWYSGFRPPVTAGLQIADISPSGRLGGARDSMYWSQRNASAWISRGASDARAAQAKVVECLRWADSAAPREKTTGWPSIVSTVSETASGSSSAGRLTLPG